MSPLLAPSRTLGQICAWILALPTLAACLPTAQPVAVQPATALATQAAPTSLAELATATAPPPTPRPAPTTVTAVPPVEVTIDTPPPDTLVGSPVVITGRTGTMPAASQLSYRVLDDAGAEIGAGALSVRPAGGGGEFAAELFFELPHAGGLIAVELYQESQASQPALASLTLLIASQQAISIESPPRGTTVGNPFVITGRTARPPFGGRLAYRIAAADGSALGEGRFAVTGPPDGPAAFNTSLEFRLPATGGPISLELRDEEPQGVRIAAAAQLQLFVAAPALSQPTAPPATGPTGGPTTPAEVTQQITIATPAPGALVDSPLVVTGRTARAPFGGSLSYTLADGAGTALAEGAIPAGDQAAGFTTSITFSAPPAGGPITLTVLDRNPATGAIAAQVTVELQVAPCVGLTCVVGAGPSFVLPSGEPNEPPYLPCQAPSDEAWIDTYAPIAVQLGQIRSFYACTFTSTLTSALLTLSDGSTQPLSIVSPPAGSGAVAMVRWVAMPTSQLGTYTLTLSAANGAVASLDFQVMAPGEPHILVQPQAVAAGAAFDVLLVNFPAGAVVTVQVFGGIGEAPGGALLPPLGSYTQTIDHTLSTGGGLATLTIQSQAEDPAGVYVVQVQGYSPFALLRLR
jgi:hypothetical protein